jgi:carbonic anhydrase
VGTILTFMLRLSGGGTYTGAAGQVPARRLSMADTGSPSPLTRRDLLRLAALAGGVTGGLSGGTAHAQAPKTPQEALKTLMDGNARFVSNAMTSFDEDLDLIRKNLEESQEPFATILSCADSRVPVEIVFDQTFGRLFVTRVAGNIATPEIVASLEYSTGVLSTVNLVMVLGHGNCGAVKATIDGKAVPGQISALYTPIRPAVDRAGANLEAATRANAVIQAGLLRTASPVIADRVARGTLLVVAAIYDIVSARVSLIS